MSDRASSDAERAQSESATISLEEFTKDFAPEERAQVAARTAELAGEELALRDLARTGAQLPWRT